MLTIAKEHFEGERSRILHVGTPLHQHEIDNLAAGSDEITVPVSGAARADINEIIAHYGDMRTAFHGADLLVVVTRDGAEYLARALDTVEHPYGLHVELL